jgi:lipoate-protein ligase A
MEIDSSKNSSIFATRLRTDILKTIFGEHEVEEYKLTDEDWKNIEALSNEKYRTWDLLHAYALT